MKVLLRLIASLAAVHFSCSQKSSKLSYCYYQFIVQHLVSCVDGLGSYDFFLNDN